jgi:alpha-D-ribose 1-methylphosphonate 5-triphosphate synthase subunit PhnG
MVVSERADEIGKRQAVMSLCAEARAAELACALEHLAPVPVARDLRAPETGLVMLRGRAGGDGAAFNLGEATVARAAVLLGDGSAPGFAYHLGRDLARARNAAILDALWQQPDRRADVEAALSPVRDRLSRDASLGARRTAATRVDFFTLVRGED